jgi:hypothetical protein
MMSERHGVAVTALTRVREVLGSNLDWHASYRVSLQEYAGIVPRLCHDLLSPNYKGVSKQVTNGRKQLYWT